MESGSRKILIVDDDPDIVLTLATILEDTGYAVIPPRMATVCDKSARPNNLI